MSSILTFKYKREFLSMPRIAFYYKLENIIQFNFHTVMSNKQSNRQFNGKILVPIYGIKSNNSAVLVVYLSSFFIITAQQFAINVNWISLSNIYSTTFPVFLFQISTKNDIFSVLVLDYNFMYGIHSHQLTISLSFNVYTCSFYANLQNNSK